jgi:hypothetical protein
MLAPFDDNVDETSHNYRAMLPFQLSFGETLATLTFAYVVAVASFNAGYFQGVPSRFVELFSFADLVNTNIPILQYIIGLFSIYCILSLVFFIPGRLVSGALDRVLSATPLRNIDFNTFSIIVLVVMGGGCWYYSSELDRINNPFFSLEFVPCALFYAILLDSSWGAYRLKQISRRTLVFQLAINAIMFCYMSGRMWIKYEVRVPTGVQAMYTQNGCLDRKLLRSTSNGYLLYSFDLKQFEYREKSEIKTIYGSRGCV